MSDENPLEVKIADMQVPAKELLATEPPIAQPAPAKLSPEQIQELDAAFAATLEPGGAAGLFALWASGPMLADLVGEHLRQEKKRNDEDEPEQPKDDR